MWETRPRKGGRRKREDVGVFGEAVTSMCVYAGETKSTSHAPIFIGSQATVPHFEPRFRSWNHPGASQSSKAPRDRLRSRGKLPNFQVASEKITLLPSRTAYHPNRIPASPHPTSRPPQPPLPHPLNRLQRPIEVRNLNVHHPRSLRLRP